MKASRPSESNSSVDRVISLAFVDLAGELVAELLEDALHRALRPPDAPGDLGHLESLDAELDDRPVLRGEPFQDLVDHQPQERQGSLVSPGARVDGAVIRLAPRGDPHVAA